MFLEQPSILAQQVLPATLDQLVLRGHKAKRVALEQRAPQAQRVQRAHKDKRAALGQLDESVLLDELAILATQALQVLQVPRGKLVTLVPQVLRVALAQQAQQAQPVPLD